MQKPSHLSRRQFLVRSCLGIAVPYFIPATVLGKPGRQGANDKVGLGFIGVGRRGQQILGDFEVSRITSVCDVFRPRVEKVGSSIGAKSFVDYRRILQRKDVDAVVIATPDHWHALMAIEACQAGKDVYCEKPLALTIGEGRKMVHAARKYDRVFAVGTQQRSLRPNEIACKVVRDGLIGKVHRVIAHNYWGSSRERLPGEEVPSGLNWDKWLGQVPADIPFNNKYIFPEEEPGWTGYYWFAGGEMTGWGAHGFDMIQWALGMDDSGPVEVECLGEPSKEANQTGVRWRYANGVAVETGDAPRAGGKFFCERGQINIDRNRFSIMPAGLKEELLKPIGEIKEARETDHMQNFLECVRSRQRPNADVQIGHRSVSVAHLGNIARWVGGKLAWDPARQRFDNEEANRHLHRRHREGYELPKV